MNIYISMFSIMRSIRCPVHAENQLSGSIVDPVDLRHPGRCSEKDHGKADDIHHHADFDLMRTREEAIVSVYSYGQPTMSMTLIAPLLNTMAFGGVANEERDEGLRKERSSSTHQLPIGNMKASDTASVHGRMRKAG